jgi:glyoxylase-like metal-dependent hydrolase (beta-lactamase superfamily II)
MKIHHLSCGTLCPIGALLINGVGGILEPSKLVCHCLLIEGSDGLILVDTGLGIQDMANPGERLGKLPSSLYRIEQDFSRTAVRQIKSLGFRPEDVRDIVMTHLDCDHAGGISDFPWARVHVQDVEQIVATHPETIVEKNRYSQAQFPAETQWVTHAFSQGEKWFGFEKVQPLLESNPEILMIPLPGHTRGHCGVAVKLPHGWLLHCGDAIFHRDELDPIEPSAPLGIKVLESIMKDNQGAVEANQGLLRQLYHENRDQIRFICSHDPVMFEQSLSIEVPAAAYLS